MQSLKAAALAGVRWQDDWELAVVLCLFILECGDYIKSANEVNMSES